MAKKKKKKDGEAMAKAKAAKEVKPKKSKKAKKDKKVEKAKKVRVAEPMDDTQEKSGKKEERLETIANLVDHPLVADLVAAGAVAAVGALAEKKVTAARGTKTGSKAALKLAGAAAASAIGKRLMAEFEEAKKRREDEEE